MCITVRAVDPRWRRVFSTLQPILLEISRGAPSEHPRGITTFVKPWHGWHNVQPNAFCVIDVVSSYQTRLDHLHSSEMMLTVESQHRLQHPSRPAVANREYGLKLGREAPKKLVPTRWANSSLMFAIPTSSFPMSYLRPLSLLSVRLHQCTS